MKSKSQKGKNPQKSKNTKSKNNNKNNNNSSQSYIEESIDSISQNLSKKNIIIFFTIFSTFLMIYFQYKYEMEQKLGNMGTNQLEEYYNILGIEYGSDINSIRKAYKKLSKIWHPDKHPNCESCKEKFLQINKAHENLIKMEQENFGKNNYNIFKSHPVVLNDKNYHKLVEKSDDLWIICVYEGTQEGIDYLSSVSSVFDEISFQKKNIVRFGIIDLFRYNKLSTYLPYKFPYLPAIYSHLTGECNEYMDNVDNINIMSFNNFILQAYHTKIKVLEMNEIKSLFYNNKDNVNNNNEFNIKKNLNLEFFIITSKNDIDLVARDFYRRYNDYIKLYQNSFNIYDDTLKLFNEKNNYKVYIKYNDINNENNNELKTKIEPIPISINIKDDFSHKLENAFELGKKLIFPEIYQNNIMQHCASKLEENEENNKIIDLCIIQIDHEENDKNIEKQIDKILYKTLIKNYYENIKNKNKKKNSEDIYLNINFGYVNYLMIVFYK